VADRPRTAGELDAWCDKLAIHETVYRYTDALNRADWPALAGLFAPAAVWEMTEPTVRHYEGATAIAERLGGLLAKVEMLFQTAHNPVVTHLDGDRASARCAVREMVRRTGVAEFVIFGIYSDELVCRDGEWRFLHRRFRGVYLDESPLAGTVTLARTELA
jgi:hypothetical protein